MFISLCNLTVGSSTHDSDEAIAAFLEVSGQSLDALSVNNIHRVRHHYALPDFSCGICNLSFLPEAWISCLAMVSHGYFILCVLSSFSLCFHSVF
jgi:DNA repair protein RAD7